MAAAPSLLDVGAARRGIRQSLLCRGQRNVELSETMFNILYVYYYGKKTTNTPATSHRSRVKQQRRSRQDKHRPEPRIGHQPAHRRLQSPRHRLRPAAQPLLLPRLGRPTRTGGLPHPLHRPVYYTPASVNLNGIDAILSLRPNPSKALKEILSRPIDNRTDGTVLSDSVAESFDFIFIDTQPAMSRMTYNALYAADGYIIPTELEEASVKGMANIAVAAGKVGADTGNLTIHGILITKLDAKLRSAKLYEPQIRQSFRETFKTAIRRSKDIIESQALREDVFTTYSLGRAAEDYTALATEYLRKFA